MRKKTLSALSLRHILELRDYGYTAEDMVPLRKEAALDYHRMGSKIYCLGSDGGKGEYASKAMIQAHEGLFGMESQMWERIRNQDLDYACLLYTYPGAYESDASHDAKGLKLAKVKIGSP